MQIQRNAVFFFLLVERATRFKFTTLNPSFQPACTRSIDLRDLLYAAGASIALIIMQLLRIRFAMTPICFRNSTQSLVNMRSAPNPCGLVTFNAGHTMTHFC